MSDPAATGGVPTGGAPAGAYDDPALLRAIITVLTSGSELSELLRGVADVIVTASRTDACFVHLLDAAQDRLVLSGASPGFEEAIGSVTLAVGEGVAGWVAAHGRPVVISDDKQRDPRYVYLPVLRGEEFTSMASVPMRTRLGSLVGVLNVHSRERREFTASDVDLLTAVGSLMAGAVDNARLQAAATRRTLDRARLAEQLVLAQEGERRRVARDIHDGVSQRLASLGFRLSAAGDALSDSCPSCTAAAAQIAAARELTVAALDEARAAIEGLRPPVLDDLGLVAALEHLAGGLPGVRVVVDAAVLQLPSHLETAIFRIAQEALANVVRHARANTAWVTLRRRGDQAVLTVTDDGVGLAGVPTGGPSGPQPGRHEPAGQYGSYGLENMRERADMVGGTISVVGREGGGTTVRFAVPLPPAGPSPTTAGSATLAGGGHAAGGGQAGTASSRGV